MNSSTLLQVAEAVGLVFLGLVSPWFSHRAAKLSEPTGNGFTRDLFSRLDRMESKQDHLSDQLTEHLRDHAFPVRNGKD